MGLPPFAVPVQIPVFLPLPSVGWPRSAIDYVVTARQSPRRQPGADAFAKMPCRALPDALTLNGRSN